jgi:hypothetical protein
VQKIRPSGDSGDPLPPMDLYRLAVEEYRFQAQFNWTRTQYLLGFNVAILAAGTAVSGTFGGFALPVFLLGLVAAVLSLLVMRQQADYYRAARDRVRRLEERYGVDEAARVDTTSTLGGRSRSVSVKQLVNLLTGAVGLADVVAAVYVVFIR